VSTDDPVAFTVRRSHAFGILGLLVGLAVGIFLGSSVLDGEDQPVLQVPAELSSEGGAPQPAAPPQEVNVDTEGRPAIGPEDAEVTIVEFIDYECPFCGEFARDTLPQIEREYGDEVRFVVRNLPLENIHPDARVAAEAAECAFEQGRFWAYHDVLFENQDALNVPDLKRYAREAGLDAASFDRCLDSADGAAAVQADVSDANEYGITSTPTFFVNGQRLEGALPFSQFRAEIDAALAE
jgi:protein-disulfide isomerase